VSKDPKCSQKQAQDSAAKSRHCLFW